MQERRWLEKRWKRKFLLERCLDEMRESESEVRFHTYCMPDDVDCFYHDRSLRDPNFVPWLVVGTGVLVAQANAS
jgi:hypothetical protein